MKLSNWQIPLAVAVLLMATTAALGSGDCTDYTDLTGLNLPITTNGTTLGATEDFGPFTAQPDCWQGDWDEFCANSGDVTFKWTAPQDGEYTITLRGSSALADLLIYEFTCPAEPLYPEDFLCGAHRNFQDRATVREIELAAGQEILIVVDGWLIWNGEFTLAIYDNTTPSASVAMYMDFYHYPGMSAAAAWIETGRWRDDLGLANIEEELPLDDDHLIRVYSTSKIVTVTALMQLWEDGHFDLDDDVNEYLDDDFSVRHPGYPWTPITFRMLMCHVAGIAGNWTNIADFAVCDGNDSPIALCEMMEGYFTPGGAYYSVTDNFTDGRPGTVWEYNSVDTALMGCLVEHINPDGLTFDDYCRAHIFDPLQMPASSFLLANIDPDDLATQYEWIDQDHQALPHCTAANYPATSLRTNASELSRFLLAYMQGGELYGQRILEAATIDTMLTVHYPDIPSGDLEQGLIWYSLQLGDNEVWGHSGAGVPARGASALAFSRDKGIGAVMIANSNGSGTTGRQDIIDVLLRYAEECDATGVAVPDGPAATPALAQLGPCFPNPFNPRTTVSFSFDRDIRAQVGVYDLAGKLVSMLAEQHFSAGEHRLQWDGRDLVNHALPSGVYLVRLKTEHGVQARKVMLIQ